MPVDTSKVDPALKKAAKDPHIEAIAVAAFQFAFDEGLRQEFERLQATWPPDAPAWAAWKKRHGFKAGTWEMTGKTLAGITHNAPSKLKMTGGVKFGINWKNLRAFAIPRSFTDKKGKKLSAALSDRVYQTLRRGSAKHRIAKHAEKKGRSLEEALSGAFGPKRSAKTIPARPLFEWNAAWELRIAEDVEAAIKKIVEEEGLA